MLSYKDKTFCNYYKECKNGKTCHRALTKEVINNANEWWKRFNIDEEVPISIFIEKPDCYGIIK